MKEIETQMAELSLHGMSRAWMALLETRKHHELSLSEGLKLLLQNEYQSRKNNRFERLNGKNGLYPPRENGHIRSLFYGLAMKIQI